MRWLVKFQPLRKPKFFYPRAKKENVRTWDRIISTVLCKFIGEALWDTRNMFQHENVASWLEASKDAFQPPVCAKLLYGFDWPTKERGQLKVMYVNSLSFAHTTGLLEPQMKERIITSNSERHISILSLTNTLGAVLHVARYNASAYHGPRQAAHCSHQGGWVLLASCKNSSFASGESLSCGLLSLFRDLKLARSALLLKESDRMKRKWIACDITLKEQITLRFVRCEPYAQW